MHPCYQVVLSSEPLGNVVVRVAVAAEEQGQVTLSQSSVVVTPLAWRTGATVSIISTNDNIAEVLQVTTPSHDMRAAGVLRW